MEFSFEEEKKLQSFITLDRTKAESSGWSESATSRQKDIRLWGVECHRIWEGPEQDELPLAWKRWNSLGNLFRTSYITFCHRRDLSFKSFQIFHCMSYGPLLFHPLFCCFTHLSLLTQGMAMHRSMERSNWLITAYSNNYKNPVCIHTHTYAYTCIYINIYILETPTYALPTYRVHIHLIYSDI